MATTLEKLSTLAERLAPEQQQVLVEIAENLMSHRRFYDLMTPQQRAELDAALAEADRGEGVGRTDVDQRLDALFSRYGA